MKPSIKAKLNSHLKRYQELKNLLSDHKVTEDLARYRDLSKECSQLESIVFPYQGYQHYAAQLEDAKALLSETDPELQQLAKQEIKETEKKMAEIEEKLLIDLLPQDPFD